MLVLGEKTVIGLLGQYNMVYRLAASNSLGLCYKEKSWGSIPTPTELEGLGWRPKICA